MNGSELSTLAVRSARECLRFSGRYPVLDALVEQSVVIPGLDDGYVPQGLAWLTGGRVAIGLHHEKKVRPSRVAVVCLSSAAPVRSHPLVEVDGTPYIGHAGGVAMHAGALWVSSGRKIRRLPLEALEAARTGASLRFDREFGVHARGSFLFADGDRLWAGEFTWNGAYPPFAHPPCPNAPRRGAWIAAYRIALETGLPPSGTYLVKGETIHPPEAVVFVPDSVQGAVRVDGMMVLGRSVGPADSQLVLYRDPLLDRDPEFEVPLPGGARVPGWQLVREEPLATMRMPAGAQDLDHRDGVLATPFESGARKYRRAWRVLGAGVEDRVLAFRVPGARAAPMAPQVQVPRSHNKAS